MREHYSWLQKHHSHGAAGPKGTDLLVPNLSILPVLNSKNDFVVAHFKSQIELLDDIK